MRRRQRLAAADSSAEDSARFSFATRSRESVAVHEGDPALAPVNRRGRSGCARYGAEQQPALLPVPPRSACRRPLARLRRRGHRGRLARAPAQGRMPCRLKREPNSADPDGIYSRLIDATGSLSDSESTALNARLVLLLANHIGDEAVCARRYIAARAPMSTEVRGDARCRSGLTCERCSRLAAARGVPARLSASAWRPRSPACPNPAAARSAPP